MKIFKLYIKIITLVLIVIGFFYTSSVKSLDKFNKADRISNYFSGVLLLNENKYEKSANFFKRLNGLESSHANFSVKYLYSLVNSGNIKKAVDYSKKLEKQKKDIFESQLILGIFHLKNSDWELAQKYFLKARTFDPRFILNKYLSNSLYNWANLESSDLIQATSDLKKLDKRFDNLKKIQNVFLNCYYNSSTTSNLFKELLSNKKTDFSRYNYFYATFAFNNGNINKAKEIINSALELYPRNLLLNQYKLNLNEGDNTSNFNCKNKKHNIAEILYVTSNALSSQSIFPLSDYYLNLAKYLNQDFHSYDTLLAENFYNVSNFVEAKKVYRNLGSKGKAFHWFSSKQLARIYVQEDNKEQALKLLSRAYKDLASKGVYETFDYAEFLKNNEKFEESIFHYDKVISEIKKDHPLYVEATDGRGVAYERIGEWDKAEKDLLASLEIDPDQAYVLNYLAYSWIEQGVKIKKSLNMLEKANKLRSNDPYITDSLGWALFKLERYKESKNYLQLAVKLLPGDPIVNDHYGDALWKNGNEIQARYYWNYVLSLKKTEDELKRNIKEKLIKGL